MSHLAFVSSVSWSLHRLLSFLSPIISTLQRVLMRYSAQCLPNLTWVTHLLLKKRTCVGTTSSFSVRPIVGLGHPHIPFLVFASIKDLAGVPFWGTQFPSRLIPVSRLLRLSPVNSSIYYKVLPVRFPIRCLLMAVLHPPFNVHVC